ncbi:MAG: hypothetical protein Q9164_007822, partial [Protoblastenia rupestris]
HIAYGESLGCIVQNKDAGGLIGAIQSAYPMVGTVAVLPWLLVPLIKNRILKRFSVPYLTASKGIKKLTDVCDALHWPLLLLLSLLELFNHGGESIQNLTTETVFLSFRSKSEAPCSTQSCNMSKPIHFPISQPASLNASVLSPPPRLSSLGMSPLAA